MVIKGCDDMLVQELIDRLGLTRRAIRYYEEKGLIQPKKDEANGYRHFNEEDVVKLQSIIMLREVGMPVAEIGQLFDAIDHEEPKEKLLYYLEVQRDIMTRKWLEYRQIGLTLDKVIGNLQKNDHLWDEEIFELTRGMKKINTIRDSWTDLWEFDLLAPQFDDHVNQDPYHEQYQSTHQSIVDSISANPSEMGLELGVGTGNLSQHFIKAGVAMSGIDAVYNFIKECRKKNPTMDVRLGDCLAIPYKDHTFDFVVSGYLFKQLNDDQEFLALSEINRVLKHTGRICIADMMFKDDEEKRVYYEQNPEAKQYLFSTVNRLVHWLTHHSYQVNIQQLEGHVKIITAVKRAG